MSLNITRTEIITLTDDNGIEYRSGDPILLRIKGEDIVCRYKGLGGGFFITETLDGTSTNRYRQRSIDSCVRISGINSYPETLGAMTKEDVDNGEE